MANEETKTTEVKPKPAPTMVAEVAKPEPKLDWSLVDQKFTQIAEHLERFKGQKGHNPFMYYNKFIKPLADRYQEKDEEGNFVDRTPSLYKRVMDLKVEAPTLDKVPVATPAIISTLPPATNLWDGKKE